MARLGAQVTGLDASKDGIEAALQHRDSLNEDILNRCVSINVLYNLAVE